jgi:hypothetical protein
MTTLNELYRAISQQENAYPVPALLLDGDFNAVKLKSILPYFYQQITCANRGGKTSRSPLLHTQLSLTLHLANLTITLSS